MVVRYPQEKYGKHWLMLTLAILLGCYYLLYLRGESITDYALITITISFPVITEARRRLVPLARVNDGHVILDNGLFKRSLRIPLSEITKIDACSVHGQTLELRFIMMDKIIYSYSGSHIADPSKLLELISEMTGKALTNHVQQRK